MAFAPLTYRESPESGIWLFGRLRRNYSGTLAQDFASRCRKIDSTSFYFNEFLWAHNCMTIFGLKNRGGYKLEQEICMDVLFAGSGALRQQFAGHGRCCI